MLVAMSFLNIDDLIKIMTSIPSNAVWPEIGYEVRLLRGIREKTKKMKGKMILDYIRSIFEATWSNWPKSKYLKGDDWSWLHSSLKIQILGLQQFTLHYF